MRTHRIHVVLMAIALGLISGGCAVIHPTDPYRQLNPPKSIERPASIPARETALFQDSLSLPRAIDITLTNNPGITAAAWEVERAAAQQNLAVGELLPHLYMLFNRGRDSSDIESERVTVS